MRCFIVPCCDLGIFTPLCFVACFETRKSHAESQRDNSANHRKLLGNIPNQVYLIRRIPEELHCTAWLAVLRDFSPFINDYAKLMVSEQMKSKEIHSDNHERSIFIGGIGFRHEFSFVSSMDYVDVERRTSNIAEHGLSNYE